MVYFSVLMFFIQTYLLGYSATFFVKNSENFLERNLMRFGIGLAILPLIGLFLNILHIPIDWMIILALSMIGPLYHVIKNKPKPNLTLKITKYDISIILMLLLFFANFYIYVSGAFSYPYLEDDDSWSHAIGVKYIAMEKTVFEKENLLHYIDPYPPAYEIVLGVMHQINNSVYFTLKFFNALIVALSTIFFYFFVMKISDNRRLALFSTFALASIPAFMSHFIWALPLTVTLSFVCFYALEMISHDRRWWIVAALCMVAAFTSSPTHSTYFGLFLGLYLIAKSITAKRFALFESLAAFVGVVLSFVLWWAPMIHKHGIIGTLQGIGINIGLAKEYGVGAALMGTGDKVYTFSDFFIAQKQNMVNNPIGIGIVLSIISIIGLILLLIKFRHIFKEENRWHLLILLWLLLTLYAVNASRFALKLSPFRAWMLLAIPVCILAAYGGLFLTSIAGKIGNFGKWAMMFVLLIGIFFTSAQQKIAVNTTSSWPFGGFWTSIEEVQGHIWLKENLAPNTKVFHFANNAPIIGMDKFTCHWCPEVRQFQKEGINESAQDIINWLKENEYGYLVIDGQTARKFGENTTLSRTNELMQTGRLTPAFRNNGMFVLQLR